VYESHLGEIISFWGIVIDRKLTLLRSNDVCLIYMTLAGDIREIDIRIGCNYPLLNMKREHI
jgi:hypothetical protein